jgi:nucleotide-binding universal stress UspA family protein
VASEILAESDAADFVVLGTHGRSGFEHLMLGSVAEKVLRRAACPVLTIPRAATGATGAVPGMFHRILVGVDFSEASLRALEYALSLAEEADAHLTVLRVVEIPGELAEWAKDSGEGQGYVERWKAAAFTRLRGVVPDAAREFCHVEERVEAGQPYREILRIAAADDAGLIVVGAQGHGVLDRMFFGSTAHHVVRQASCPVLTLRAAGHAASVASLPS